MTKSELVKQAIAHKQTKEIPYAINFANDSFEKYGDELKKRYLNKKLRKAVDDGILLVEEAIEIGMGNHVFTMSHHPWWNFHEVGNEYAHNHIPQDYIPKTRATGSFEKFETRLKYIKDNFDLYIVVMSYASNYEKAKTARGIENFLADMAGYRDFAIKLMDFITMKDLSFMRDLITYDEVDGVLYGSDWGSQRSLLMSPKTFRELIVPGEIKRYDLTREFGKDIWIHSCGAIEEIIPDLIELGIDVLNPIQSEVMDIYQLKKEYGKDLTFWGGISTQHTLPSATPKEIKAESKKIIDAMSVDGGFITAASQHIQADVPLENIFAFIESANTL